MSRINRNTYWARKWSVGCVRSRNDCWLGVVDAVVSSVFGRTRWAQNDGQRRKLCAVLASRSLTESVGPRGGWGGSNGSLPAKSGRSWAHNLLVCDDTERLRSYYDWGLCYSGDVTPTTSQNKSVYDNIGSFRPRLNFLFQFSKISESVIYTKRALSECSY